MMKGQLKVENREKERRIRPIKQPSKAVRAPILLDEVGRHQEESGTKLGEKDGLKQMMGNMAAVADDFKNNNRQSIVTNLLQTGNVQSFIDLFYITHKCLPNVMDKKNYFGQKLHIPDLPHEEESTLQFYSDFAASLSKAEVKPDTERAQKDVSMSEYNSVAFNYEDQGDFVTAAYFYKKVIELAVSCNNKQYELVALLGLGKCHDQMKMREKAIDILEEAFDNASTLEQKEQRSDMVKLIGKELVEIYIERAEELVKFEVVDASLKAYESALAIAQRAGERQSEARISHKIGELYYLEGEYTRSVEYQEQYLAKLKQSMEDEEGRENEEAEKKDGQTSLKSKEMDAHASLAKCYLKLKDIEEAEIHLNEYHRMAKEAKAQNAVADSSYYLGKLFEEKGEKDKAINYYQSYFEAAKSEKPDKKDRKLVDKARVTFAISKANKNMDKYIGLFEGEEDSLRRVLEWKIKRILK